MSWLLLKLQMAIKTKKYIKSKKTGNKKSKTNKNRNNRNNRKNRTKLLKGGAGNDPFAHLKKKNTQSNYATLLTQNK